MCGLIKIVFCFLALTINQITSDNNNALYLSKLIAKGSIEDARNLSLVDPKLFLGVKSHSGYLTLNEEYESNMFFWYFPKEKADVKTPWILWLQGGPGISSLAGLFNEIGPFESRNNTLKLREWSWCRNYSVLFLDNPIGAGYSYTKDVKGYSDSMTEYTNNLYSVLQQFLTMYPELRQAPLYLAGEAYAGHYIPALALELLDRGKGNETVNLQGLIMDNPTIERLAVSNYSAVYYAWGLIDGEGLAAAKPYQDAYTLALRKGKNDAAFQLRETLLDVLELHLSKILEGNAVQDTTSTPLREFVSFLNNETISSALHVGDMQFTLFSAAAKKYLKNEFSLDIRPMVEKVLDYYQVLIYCGQLDLISPCVPSAEARRKWRWNGSNDFLAAPRLPWLYNHTNAGYFKTGGNLTEVLIRGAANHPPLEKPAETFELITSFIEGSLTLQCPNCSIPEHNLPNDKLNEYLTKWNLNLKELTPKTDSIKGNSASGWTVFSSILNVILLSGIGVAGYIFWKRRRRNDMLYMNATDAFDEAQSHSVLSLS